MSIDLKGNTNYVALKNLQDQVVVPRTNLAAVDMNVANGLTVEDNTLGMEIADPLQLTTGASGNGVLNADVLKTALSFARASEFDVNAQPYIITGNSATLTDTDGVRKLQAIPVESGSGNVIGLAIQGPLPVVSEVAGKYLVVADVKSDTGAASIELTAGTVVPVDNYTGTSTTTGVWTRLAFIIDTTETGYTGGLTFVARFDDVLEGPRDFSYKNAYVVSVTDINDVYINEMASVIGTEQAYVFKPGYGIDILDGTISTVLETADTKAVLDGEPDVLVSTKSLSSAISTGKAVDVTNAPNVSAGNIARGLGAKDPVTWTGVTSGNIGFYEDSNPLDDIDTTFPAYAPGLVYLMLANVKNNGTANVVISGANGLNGTLPVTITPGSEVRVAKMFTTKTDGYFSASSTAELNLTFSYFREYEVTGCTEDSKKYIAALENPDNTDDYYLIDEDTVNPWMTMIDMHESKYTLVQPGLAYKLFANTGDTHTIAVPNIKSNKYGRPAYMELFVGSESNIKLDPPLSLAQNNSFTDNTLNNCSIRFMDGIATLTVDSVESSYIVNLTGGTYTTESGTLAYGIETSDAAIIIFNSSVDGQEVSLEGSTAGVRTSTGLTILGNGITNTKITGTGTFGSAYTTTIKAVSFKNATLSGSSISLGSTIAVEGKLTNNGTLNVAEGTVVIVAGASTNATAMDGSGSISFGDGSMIDASQNETGGIVLGSDTSTITVPSNASITFKRPDGLAITITGSKSGKYLTSIGTLLNNFYSVSNKAASGANTLNYGLTTASDSYILFAHSVDGQTCSVGTLSQPINRIVRLLGNGQDSTIVGGDISVGSDVTAYLFDLTLTGSTTSGAGTIYLRNVAVKDVENTNQLYIKSAAIPADSYLKKSGSVVMDGNSTLSGSGILDLNGSYLDTNRSTDITGITITNGFKPYNTYSGYLQFTNNSGHTTNVTDCLITGNTGFWSIGGGGGYSTVNFKNCRFIDNKKSPGDYASHAYLVYRGGRYSSGPVPSGKVGDYGTTRFENCTFTGNQCNSALLYAYYSAHMDIVNCTISNNDMLGNKWLNINSGETIVRVTDSTVTQGRMYGYGIYPKIIYSGNNRIDGWDSDGLNNRINTLFVAGSIMDLSHSLQTAEDPVFGAAQNLESMIIGVEQSDDTWKADGTLTIYTADSKTAILSGCKLSGIYNTGKVYDYVAIVAGDMETWVGTNITFASPLDLSGVTLAVLTNDTFIDNSAIVGAPAKLQIPTGSTISMVGNTSTLLDGKLIKAGCIVVGTNESTPVGTATVINSSGDSSTIEGIGTYIAKDGTNDFVTTDKITRVSAVGSAGAGTLGDALAAETAVDGTNRFVKLDNNLTATAAYTDDQTITDKMVITNEYDGLFGGSFDLTSASSEKPVLTISESTKTVAINGGRVVFSNGVIPNGATFTPNCVVSGAATMVMSGGGTIDLGYDWTAGTGGGKIYINGADTPSVVVKDLTITNGSSTETGGYGALTVANAAMRATIENVKFIHNKGSICGGCGVAGGTVTFSRCVFEANEGYDTSSYTGQNGLRIDNDSVVTVKDCTFKRLQTLYMRGNSRVGTVGLILDGTNVLDGYCATHDLYNKSIEVKANAVLDHRTNPQTTYEFINVPGRSNSTAYGGIIFDSPGAKWLYNDSNGKVVEALIGGGTFASVNPFGVLKLSTVSSGTTLQPRHVETANHAMRFDYCTITGGTAEQGGGIEVASNGALSLIGCNVYGNVASVGSDIYAENRVTVVGGTYGSCTLGDGGYFIVSQGATLDQIVRRDTNVTGASVTIIAGASVTLLDQISPGPNKIIIKKGGCKINGSSFAAPSADVTYTSIVNNNGTIIAN